MENFGESQILFVSQKFQESPPPPPSFYGSATTTEYITWIKKFFYWRITVAHEIIGTAIILMFFYCFKKCTDGEILKKLYIHDRQKLDYQFVHLKKFEEK